MKKDSSGQAGLGLQVTVTLEHFHLTKELVEKLAYRSFAIRHREDPISDYAILLTSIEAYVKGHYHLVQNDHRRRVSFTGSYFFTCEEGISGANHILWAHSLS